MHQPSNTYCVSLKGTAHAPCCSGVPEVLSSSKAGSIAVVLQLKNLPVSQQHELSRQRNFLASDIAVCVLLSTSHPVHVSWKTACEQQITLPGNKGAGGKQGKEVKSTAKQVLLHLCLKEGILSDRNSITSLAWMPRGSERVMLVRWRKKASSR